MSLSKTVPISLLSCLALTACSGSGGSSSSNEAVTAAVPSYQTLSSTNAGTSALGGATVAVDTTTGALINRTVSGEITHNTDARTINDGVVNMVDTDGSGPGMPYYTDGTAEMYLQQALGSYDYEYINFATLIYPSNGKTYNAVGVIGIITRAEDMPTNKPQAEYTGGAYFFEENKSTAQRIGYTFGTTKVLADFAAGKVSATVSGLQADSGTAKFDQVVMNDMDISGNGFSGSNVTLLLNGQTVSPTGTVETRGVTGTFFGYDAATGTPSEVGGVAQITGQDTLVGGVFMGH